MDEMIEFMVTSGFGHNTQAPFVQVVIESADFMTQMSPQKARELAMNLMTAADAAESDGFLVTFLRDKIECADMRMIASILTEFRKWRDNQRQSEDQADGDSNPMYDEHERLKSRMQPTDMLVNGLTQAAD